MAKVIDLTPKHFPIIPAKEKIELPVSFDDIELSGIKTGNLIREISNASKLKTAAKMADCIVAKSGGDYTSIQAALDVGKTNIFVKKGTYEISSPITIMSSGVTIRGESKVNTIIKLANGANCHAIVVGDGATNLSDIVIEDIQLDGNKVNQTATSFGIRFWGDVQIVGGQAVGYQISKSVIKDCIIKDFLTAGIVFKRGCDNVISGNIITGSEDGISFDNPYNCQIINNIIRDNSYADIGANGDAFIITNNQICVNGDYGIKLTGDRSVINGNNFSTIASDKTAIYLDTVQYATVIGNNFNGDTGHTGIYIDSGGSNIIMGNIFTSVVYGLYGIRLYNTGHNEIIGNTIHSYTSGIYLASGDNSIIVANHSTGNKEYGINVSDAASDNNLVVKNYLTGNTTGGLNNAGTGTIIAASTTNDNVV